MKSVVAVLALSLLAGCARKNIENESAIRDAMVDYLKTNQSKLGLNIDSMDILVPAMAFERDTARATIKFQIKGTDQGMQFNYTLDRKGDKWVVRGKQDSSSDPHGGQITGGETLPEGHPTVPEGHPAVPEGHPALPEGHPSVDTPAGAGSKK